MIDPHDMDKLTEAHNRAIQAVLDITDSDVDQADELVTSISILIFETFKKFIGENNAANN